MCSNFLLGNIGWLWKEPGFFSFLIFFLAADWQSPWSGYCFWIFEVGVDHASGCSALPLVAAFSPHPHVFYRVGVGSSHRVHEVDLVINSQVSIANVSDGVICSPKVWYNSRSRPDELLYAGQESGSVLLWNSNQEPFLGGGIDATEHPLLRHWSSSDVFSADEHTRRSGPPRRLRQYGQGSVESARCRCHEESSANRRKCARPLQAPGWPFERKTPQRPSSE